MNKRILLIRTGGTIDAEPYSDPANPPEIVTTLKNGQSFLASTVNALPNHERVDGLVWNAWQEDRFVKDSQLFTADDMCELAETIKNDDHRLFIITHGTDAMIKNATMLQEALKGSDKVVVFVGAMVPLSMHSKHESDGVDALYFALQKSDGQSAGVYVVGRDVATKRLAFFNPAHVEKDRQASLKDLRFTLGAR